MLFSTMCVHECRFQEVLEVRLIEFIISMKISYVEVATIVFVDNSSYVSHHRLEGPGDKVLGRE